MGEPLADASAANVFAIAEKARELVTVVLTGDGGDEAFGGYPRYAHLASLAHADRVPRILRRGLSRATSAFPAGGWNESARSRALRVTEMLALDSPQRYVAYMTSMGGGLSRDELYTDEYGEMLGESMVDGVILGPWRDSSARSLGDVMLDVDTSTYLPGDLLTKMDIATMAFSLEARAPLLDHELLGLAASLPFAMKVRRNETKVALRAALRAWLPDEILDRPKRGFEVPMARWLRGELRAEVTDVLLDPGAAGASWFRRSYVQRLLQRHFDGKADNSKGIWTLFMLELWYRSLSERALTSDRVSQPKPAR
jgi:asparagine synthase (glutamine-hydrolysing)